MKTVVALFDDLRRAERALRSLLDDDVRSDLVSLAAAAGEQDVDPRSSDGDYVSGIFRARSGVAASLAQLLPDLAVIEVADVGTVLASGPLLLPWAGEPSVPRSLHDALVVAGVPCDHAERYGLGVRSGGALVVVVAPLRSAARIAEVLSACAPRQLDPARAH